MQATFAFGKSGLTVSLPEGRHYDLLESRSADPILDVQAELGNALDRPIASRPLIERAAGKRTAAISVCAGRIVCVG